MAKKDLNTTLSFTADFQQNTTDTLKSGSEVTIIFDSERLPFERSVSEKGKPEWSISAFVQFADNVISEIKLVPAKKGKTVDTNLKGVFTVPAETNQAILWFVNSGKSGNVYFDSNFGQNYRFPVVSAVEVKTAAPGKKAMAKKA